MSSFFEGLKAFTPRPSLWKNPFKKHKPHIDWIFPKSGKKQIIVLGSGWGGYGFASKINRQLYDVIMVSPRNHFLFTPLLASTTVGTLEFRCITEPVRALKDLKYHQGRCMEINEDKNSIIVRDSFDITNFYELKYDYLIYSIGCKANDFGINGVKEHAQFLKQIRHAQKIREKIQELFEKCDKPTTSRNERDKLLSFIVVGGGPTSIEFAAEFHDWISQDGSKMFPHLMDHVNITLIEATNRLLSGFGSDLADYTLSVLKKRKIKVLTNTAVINVTDEYVELNDGYTLNYGLIVWATGNSSVDLTNNVEWEKTKSGRIKIDNNLNVLGKDNIYAIGDCTEMEVGLPMIAQVASQQGYYLARMFNELTTFDPEHFNEEYKKYKATKPFNFFYRGTMLYVGGYKGAVGFPGHNQFVDNKTPHESIGNEIGKRVTSLKGIRAWLFWRTAYLTMLRSAPNQILVPMYWFKAFVFGRDFSRF